MSQKVRQIKLGLVGGENAPWEYVAEKLRKEDIEFELVTFSDYFSPNKALSEGLIDANAYQHKAFLNTELADKHYDFEVYGETYLDPIGIYSRKIKSLSELKSGDSVAIPSDRANEIRALKVLKGEDLIDFEVDGTSGDIKLTNNKLNLEIKRYDAALLYSSLEKETCAFINGNYAFEKGLNPVTDSIFREKLDLGNSDNQFVKVLVARSNLDEDKQRVLRRALFYYQTSAVAEIIKKMQGGSLIPAFLSRF